MNRKRKLVADVRRYVALQRDLLKRFGCDDGENVTVRDGLPHSWSFGKNSLRVRDKEMSVKEGPCRGPVCTAVYAEEGPGKYVVYLLDNSKEVPWE